VSTSASPTPPRPPGATKTGASPSDPFGTGCSNRCQSFSAGRRIPRFLLPDPNGHFSTEVELALRKRASSRRRRVPHKGLTSGAWTTTNQSSRSPCIRGETGPFAPRGAAGAETGWNLANKVREPRRTARLLGQDSRFDFGRALAGSAPGLRFSVGYRANEVREPRRTARLLGQDSRFDFGRGLAGSAPGLRSAWDI